MEKCTLACWADVGKLNYIIIDMLGREATAHTCIQSMMIQKENRQKQITKPKN